MYLQSTIFDRILLSSLVLMKLLMILSYKSYIIYWCIFRVLIYVCQGTKYIIKYNL